MHNFSLSYTRRVSNPNGEDLSPYILYGDNNCSTGNPMLLQTFTNSINAGWTKFFEKFGNVGLTTYFRHSNNEQNSMSDAIYNNSFGRIVPYTYPVNSGKTLSSGLEANITYRLKTFMQIRFYANGYYTHIETKLPKTATRPAQFKQNDYFGYNFRLNFWTKLWKVLEVNASANYHSKTNTIYSTSRPTYSIDCGMRGNFFQRKLSVFFDITDIFNWNKQETDVNSPYLIAYNSSKYTSRTIRAGITVKLGKMELESKAQQGQGEGGGGQQGRK
jgi:outer membrane receptor protein involved in Fe transport